MLRGGEAHFLDQFVELQPQEDIVQLRLHWPESFREAYGFDPIHIIDLKALMGDASDNIAWASSATSSTWTV